MLSTPDDFKRHLPEFEDDSTAWFLIFLDLFLDSLDQIATLMQHARADSLSLSKRSFLEMEERGKAFVFVLGPKLAPLVSGTER